jgi:uncharacterized protein
MKIAVKVVPGAKNQQIQAALDGSLKVWLKAEAKEGKANKALIEFLADYYRVGKSSVCIVSGLKNKSKIVEVDK